MTTSVDIPFRYLEDEKARMEVGKRSVTEMVQEYLI
jgi:hypothetical protein